MAEGQLVRVAVRTVVCPEANGPAGLEVSVNPGTPFRDSQRESRGRGGGEIRIARVDRGEGMAADT